MAAFDEFEGGESIPTYLELSPTGTPSSLPVATRLQILPIGELTWDNFERLCLRYVRSFASVDRCQRYGVPGQDQAGIDLYARFRDPAHYGVYQCKRVKDFGQHEIDAAVDKFIGGKWQARAKAFTICTSHPSEDTHIADAIEDAAARLEKLGIKFDLLGPERLSEWLKDQPSIVDDFFHRVWVKVFCGEEALNKLADRLTSSDVVSLRKNLGHFYSTLFNRHDPGIPIRPRLGDRDIPLRERFVVPSVYASFGVDVKRTVGPAPLKEDGDRGTVSHEETDTRRALSGLVERVRSRIPAAAWLSQADRSIVLGPPGSGKSVLLRMLAIDLLSEQPALREIAARWGQLLPVWIPFAYWTSLNTSQSSPLSLVECLERWFKQFDQTATWQLVKSALKDNRLLLLVDGLDEWTDETSARTTSQILQTFIQARNLRAVLVSRPHGFERVSMQGGDWQLGELALLSKDQQRELIKKWLLIHAQRNSNPTGTQTHEPLNASPVRSDVEAFTQRIEKARELAQLAENPLTLLLLLYLHLQNAPLPESRFASYEYVTDHFVREHPLNRRSAATLVDESTLLTPQEIRQILGHLAYAMQTEFPSGLVTESEIRSRIENILRDEGSLGLALTSSEAREVLRSFTNIEEGTLGLLVSQGQSVISFFHRSLQEYLAAVHIARLPRSDQESIASGKLADPRWREVIVALIWLCRKSEDADSLVNAIEKVVVDPVGELAKEELLAEASFGEFALSPSRAKLYATQICDRLETSFIASHRRRLLSHVLSGLRSQKMRAMIQERVNRWVFSTAFGSIRVRALQAWPASEHTWEVLYRTLHDEEAAVVRDAATVLARLFGSNPEKGDIIANLALRSLSEAQRAACIVSLSEGWPNHHLLPDAIFAGRTSPSDMLRIASTAAALNTKQTSDSDLSELIGISYDRHSSTVDYAWQGDVADLLVRGWAGNARLRDACLRARHHHFRHPEVMDRSIAQHVLVAGFPQDDEVAQFIEVELKDNHPFVGTDSIWANLPAKLRDNPRVVAALDEWAQRPQYLDPIALHHGALVGRTPVMKLKLFQALDNSFPFWAVSSLLEGWGMSDREVAEKLVLRTNGKDADQIAQYIPQILPDREQAVARLIALLRDPTSERLDFVFRGLAVLRPFKDEPEVVNVALERFQGNELLKERYVGSLIAAFPNDQRVKELAIDALVSHEVPLHVIAEAYADNEDMRVKIGERMSPLTADLRYQIVTDLSSFGDNAFALDTLRRWDSEANADVKTQAAIQFYTLIGKLNLDKQSALDYLLKLLPCYGPDHEERRQAAAAGLIALRQLELIVGREEYIGYAGKQTNVSLNTGLRRNRAFLNYLASNWSYVKTALRNDLDILRSRIGSETFWTELAAVAAEYPPLARDVVSHAEANSEFDKSAAFLFLTARLEPRSERLASHCLAVFRDQTQRHDWFDAVEAAAILLSEHFRGDSLIEARLLELVEPYGPIQLGSLMAICLGWPNSKLLKGLEVKDEEPSPYETGPLYVKYTTCSPHDLARFLEKDLSWARRNAWHSGSLTRALIARLKNDPLATENLSAVLFETVNSNMRVTVPKLLAIAGSVNSERDKWCRKELGMQRESPVSEFGFDLAAKLPKSLTLSLLESLGEVALAE